MKKFSQKQHCRSTWLCALLGAAVGLSLAFTSCSNSGDNSALLLALANQAAAKSVEDGDVVQLRTLVVGTDFNEAEKTAIKRRFPNSTFAASSASVDKSYKVIICDSTSGRIPEGSTANDANIILYELEHGDWSAWKDIITTKTSALSEQNELSAFEESLGKFPYHFFGLNRAIDSELLVRYVEKERWQAFYNNVYKDITPDYSGIGSEYLSQHKYEAGTRADQETDDNTLEIVESEVQDMTDADRLTAFFRQAARWVLNNEKKTSAQNVAASISKSEQNGNSQTHDLSKICNVYHDNIGISYNMHHELRKLAGSKADCIDGQGSWSIQFSYQPFLVTGSTANGLYYAVKANVSISNKDAYKGRWWNRHGGCYVRLTGYYLDNFIATFKPTAKIGDTEYEVFFPAYCEPTPTTQSNSVTYTSGFKWGLDGTLEVGASSKQGVSGGLKIGGHFEYSDTQTYTINDVNILNNRGFDIRSGKKVNYVSYKLQLRNLPEYKYSEHRGFTEGCDACKSTVEFNTCWLWYIPGDFTKDNMPTLKVEIGGRPEYGTMTWLSSGADLDKKSFNDGEYTETKIFRQPK